MYASHRKSTKPAFGYIISILDVDYCQAATKSEAQNITDTINTRTADLGPIAVRELYKLGGTK